MEENESRPYTSCLGVKIFILVGVNTCLYIVTIYGLCFVNEERNMRGIKLHVHKNVFCGMILYCASMYKTNPIFSQEF